MDELDVDVSVGEGVAPPVDPARIEAAVRHVLRAEGVEAGEISIALVGDDEIAALNQQYLDHEGPTDVISFHLHDRGEPPLGDVYVGVDQAARQAAGFGASVADEVLRLAVHGTLHVLGYEHPEGDDRAGSPMFVRQEALLKEFLSGGEGA
ncbi:rRNA maturation RNase YbeY [Longimicrobium sp.]|uniref:rRNA maturation RNase YbeY n=1 Tax=Longimicrobium sp. TaxID=2029185 RepID=UPI003B3B084E